MKATIVGPGVIHLEYPTQRDLTRAMVRVQEFYESPYEQIRGQHVDLQLLKKLYADTHGSWSYETDWHGFNVPGDVVEAFFEKHVTTLTDDEEQIFNAVAVLVHPDERFYLIATHRDDPDASTLPHEICHAWWALDPDYRARAVDLLRQARLEKPAAFEALAAWLLREGYSHAVLEDELHAHLATTPAEYWEKPECCGLPAQDLWQAGHALRQLVEAKRGKEG